MDEYEGKVFTPDSRTDPRADPRNRGGLDKIQNPPARETYPGGAGNPGQAPSGKPKSGKADGNA